MNSFSWNYKNFLKTGEQAKNMERPEEKEKHTRLVIDEDSIYEIDLDCMLCKEQEKQKQ